MMPTSGFVPSGSELKLDTESFVGLYKRGLALPCMMDGELWERSARDIRSMDAGLASFGLYIMDSLLSGNSEYAFMISCVKAQIGQRYSDDGPVCAARTAVWYQAPREME